MKNKRHHSPKPRGLTIFLTGIVFIIIISTMCITSAIMAFLYRNGLLTGKLHPQLSTLLFFIALLSTIIATVLTLIFSKIPLFPIRKLIAAMKELSNGNFDVRINFDYPDEFKELSKSFNNMAKELSSVELLRNDFVNNFSHEFKTPIVSLHGFAKLLKNNDLSTEERNEYLDIIIHESNRLASLATNVLNLSHIENTTILEEEKEFNISEQIRRSILLLEPKWEKKNLNININLDECTYVGNEDLLNQVWVNLLDNAIKFSPEEGKINIELMKCKNRLVFKIKDNGIGMNEETKSHVFDKFYQGDVSHTVEGNGLGLTMVKKIIELHKGSIDINSSPNKGTIISVELPLVEKL